MYASFRLEAIGDNYGWLPPMFAMRPKPWVAAILGRSAAYGLKRRFMHAKKDYSEANGVGSRGVYLYYMLPEGYYEVCELVSWSRYRRYFIRSERGKIEGVAREDVDRWLAATVSAG